MKEFLENLPVNHWSSTVLIIIGIITFVYSIYYFFSKEGRDERGRSIFAKVSMITFIVTIIIFIIFSFYTDLFLISGRAISYLIHLGLTIITTIQAIGIMLFNKLS